MNINAHRRTRSRKIVLVVSAAVLTWLVVTRSLAAFLADAAPQAALWVDSHQPEALDNLADAAVNAASATRVSAGDGDKASPQADNTTANVKSENAQSGSGKVTVTPNVEADFSAFEKFGANQSINRPIAPENAATVRKWADSALMREPLNARALRILGQLAEADSDNSSAAKFMHAADRLSLHEAVATYWLMRNSADANDYKSAIHYADILLRTNTPSYPYVLPVLAQICENKDGAALVEAVLADNPPWRAQFISTFPNDVPDARTPLGVLLALRNDSVPLTAADLRPYITRLIAHKFYSLAYYTWLQFLPAEQLRQAGLLFNGSFENPPSSLPFDWTITPGAGVTIDIVPRPDKSGEHALLVDFQYGRVDYHSVTELVMLAPGTYQFNGEYQGKLIGPRGMKWRVVCVNGAITSGGESPMITGTTADWRDLAFTFTVPAKDCGAQYVRLDLDARMASEQLVSGSILFDNLQISRVTNPPSPGG